ncbi:MAG: eukaryotic-like serine/threonine-protein kinase [Verrucomicrobiota bacterium]
MNAQQTPTEPKADLVLEIAYILLIDVVGYSKLLVNEQIELLQQLNQFVKNTKQFRLAEASGKLVKVPTGDGMALLFFRSPEEPVQCALEISRAVQSHPRIQLRMGVHGGPVNEVIDVNDRSNIAGAGLNVAQRVMDCGDAGHILLSGHISDHLSQYSHWQPFLHDLGEFEVKHGLRLHIVNLYKDKLGNPQLPEKLRRRKRWGAASGAPVRPVVASHWPQVALIAALFLSAGALVVSFLVFFHRGLSRPALATSDWTGVSEKSIAVLPFENLSTNKENAFFADGMQDEILNDLAKVADLKVISRTSVMQYKSGVPRNLREVAKALGVAHVVEGTVQRVGDRVRVSAQLIDARTDTHTWAEKYERDLADVFAIQSEVADKIVSQLKAKVSPDEKAAIQERPTHDLVAYDLYLRAKDLIFGIAFSSLGKENLFKAVQLLDEAVARDSSFLAAYRQLAGAHDRIYFLGLDHTEPRLKLAETAIQSLRRLRPDSGETHLAMAQHLYWGNRDYDQARQELAQAQRALPNDSFVLVLAGFIDRRQGRWEESVQEMERALELDPRNVSILQQLSFNYESLRRFEKMAETLDRVLIITPKDRDTQIERALVDFESRADLRPFHSIIQTIIAEDADAAAAIAGRRFFLALCERDNAGARSALAGIPAEGTKEQESYLPKSWYEGVAARAAGDQKAALAAFITARHEMETILRTEPNYPPHISLLGMIDASLGRKNDAINEGRRATEALPLSQDALTGAVLIENLAAIYAWTGEKDQAINALELLAKIPSDVNFGQLTLYPFWDPLRGDPRFDKIVASLAPK